jgi:hypothetical protein
LVCEIIITASADKMPKVTATANVNITSDATGNVALLSDFDLIGFKADGSTMDIDAFASSKQTTAIVSLGAAAR